MAHTLEGGYRLNKPESRSQTGVLVSVVTIVYNGEKYLEQTIQSVLSQSYKNIEYIIVDGGSTDGTLDIIRKYDEQLSYWKSEPDKGISDAFNKGISLATGDLVGLLNADDWYEPEAIANIVSHYEPDSVLHGNKQYWNQDGSKAHQAKPNVDILPLEMSLNHPTVFVSKSLYNKFGVFDLDYKLAMDYHLLLRLYNAGAKFLYVDRIITNMRLGGVSANIEGCYREVLKAKNEVLGNRVSHQLYYYWTMMRYRISQALSDTPLSFINSFYRTRISPIKKQY
ncbi:glycosyltransferase family 2 protein [Pontibacter virosus]|uniref:Glycosyltransferase involved in cell wall biosynthesis n=1 Tax=Pontibacter virosus TaxID=1765052 RepID=A0A2U1ARK3_9BACT|nr:glycosyltransferase family 2 protein [Pontibacter virosus]PVY39040.1 glycosyltransferase involved in cell wall biosynthesis [Pontibacter virosus]